MKTYEGYIKYNDNKHCYGLMGHNDIWAKEKLEDGDRIDIVINGERFSTNFGCKYNHPVLKPHAWDNWEFLCGLPATYYDFEKTTKEKPLTKKEKRRWRYKLCFFIFGVSLVVPAILGALFALIGLTENTTYLENFAAMGEAMFWYLGAGTAVGGILLLLNIVPINLCIGFGCALYYGTVFLSAFLSNFIYGAEINRYCISFVIVSLVCYIVWLKKFKPVDPM